MNVVSFSFEFFSFGWVVRAWDWQFEVLGLIPNQGTGALNHIWSVGWKISWSQGLVDTISRWQNGPACADGQCLFVHGYIYIYSGYCWYYLGSPLLNSIPSLRVHNKQTFMSIKIWIIISVEFRSSSQKYALGISVTGTIILQQHIRDYGIVYCCSCQ